MRRALIALALAAGVAGCTSFDERSVARSAPDAPKPGIAAPSGRLLKRKVAIARFTNETNYGTGLFTDAAGDRLGKQASDILISDLTRSGKFIVIERGDLGKLEAENALLGLSPEQFRKNLVGVDALVLGSVVEFGRKETGSTVLFSRTRTQIAQAKVNIRLVDPRTGLVFFSENGGGEAALETQVVLGVGDRAAFDATLNDKALSAAITNLIDKVLNSLEDKPWTSAVLAVEGGNVLIAGGQRQGLRSGDRLKVLTPGRVVKNPQTGLPLQLPGQQVGEVEVAGFFGDSETNEGSVCRVVSGVTPTPEHVLQFPEVR